jgi:hypothetical protein
LCTLPDEIKLLILKEVPTQYHLAFSLTCRENLVLCEPYQLERAYRVHNLGLEVSEEFIADVEALLEDYIETECRLSTGKLYSLFMVLNLIQTL